MRSERPLTVSTKRPSSGVPFRSSGESAAVKHTLKMSAKLVKGRYRNRESLDNPVD
jgi:hypothetical protein